MALSDAQLFDFNAALIVDYDDERTQAALAQHGDAFRYQLTAALHFDTWASRLEESPSVAMDPAEIRGWINALRNVAAMIRKADYLPGGWAYEDVQKTR